MPDYSNIPQDQRIHKIFAKWQDCIEQHDPRNAKSIAAFGLGMMLVNPHRTGQEPAADQPGPEQQHIDQLGNVSNQIPPDVVYA